MGKLRQQTVALYLAGTVFLTLAPTVSLAEKGAGKPVVAFIGAELEGIPEPHHKRLLERLDNLFSEQKGYLYMGPEAVISSVDHSMVMKALATREKELLLALADTIGADYLFMAKLKNRSDEPGRVMLVGDVARFDCSNGQLYRVEVLKYVENVGVELARIRLNLVDTIMEDTKASANTTLWVFATIAFLGALMLLLLKIEVKLGGEGTGGDGGTGDPTMIQ